MQSDKLTLLPFEMLDGILSRLDPLPLLRCREVHPRLREYVDQSSDYQKYQAKFQEIRAQHHKSVGNRPTKCELGLKDAAKLFTFVQRGFEFDYHFFKVLLRYPYLGSQCSVLGPVHKDLARSHVPFFGPLNRQLVAFTSCFERR